MNKNQRIQVFARCRPLTKKEKSLKSPSVVEVISEKKEISVTDKNNKRQFFFDKVFPPETDQVTVYKNVVEPLIKEVLMGYNCTVFAYGQTGTGKTYTMEGERSDSNCSWEKDEGAGVIPRFLHQLFEELNMVENVDFSVRVSFLELYNEELFDLLSTTEFSKLRLYEDPDKKGSVIIQGLEEVTVNSRDAVYNILERGTSRRQTAATMLNASSSRSHTVFSVTVHIKENTVDGEELLKIGKLNLVDLAGSENIGRSGAVEKRAREAGSINQSLLTLGRVFTALIENRHVPYRESKLTRLLQDSLGGHTKTSIIATISPAQLNLDETISTLDYASKAKNITIRPEANQKLKKRELLRIYTEQIDRLQKDLAATRSKEGVYMDTENYEIMKQSISEKSNMIKDLNGKIEAFKQKNITLEQEKSAVIDELSKKNQEYEDVVTNLTKTSDKLKLTQEKLSKVVLERDETKYLLNIYKENGEKLSSQAETLLHVADQTTSDIDGFQAKLNRKQFIEKTNAEQSEIFKQNYKKQFGKLDKMIVEMKSRQCQNFNKMQESLDLVISEYNTIKESISDVLVNIVTNQELSVDNFLLNMSKSVGDHRSQIITEIDRIKSKKIDLSTEQQTFLTETLAQSFNKLHRIKKEMDNLVLNKLNKLIQEIRQYHSYFMTKSDEKLNLIELLQNSLSLFCNHQENLLKDLEAKTESIVSWEEENEKSSTAALSRLTEFLNNQLKMAIVRKEKYNEVRNVQTDLMNNCLELKSKEEHLENLKNMQKGFISDVKFMKEKADGVNLEDVITKQNSTNCALQSLSTEMTNFVNCNQKNQDKFFTEMEDILHDNSLIIQTNHERNRSELKNITSSLSEKAKEEYESIKVKNKIMLNQIFESQSIVNKSKELSEQNAKELKEEILQRDLEIEKFFKEKHKDISTGATPQKRTYEYPKNLIAVSPDEKLLQILHSKRKNYLNSAIDVYLDCSFDADSTLLNTSFDSEDDYLTCETSMSDASVIEIKNKENLKRSANASPLPKTKRLKFTE